MRPAPTRMIEWCLCDTTALTASWASVDLDSFLSEQRRATDFVETVARRAANDSLLMFAQDSRQFAIVSMANKFLRRCTGAHARGHVQFCGECGVHSNRCFWAPCMCRCVFWTCLLTLIDVVFITSYDDNCFDYHSWRNNVVIAFGTLSSFLT